MVVVKTHHRATGIDRKGVRMSLPASRWVPASDKDYVIMREILLGNKDKKKRNKHKNGTTDVW